MATTRQKSAARRNLNKARQVQSARARGARIPRQGQGISTAAKNDLPATAFAFGRQRKEPLTDARRVRNAIARFGQVEDVTDADRDRAWKRILTAARRFQVDVSERDWRELFRRRRTASRSSGPGSRSARPGRAVTGRSAASSRSRASRGSGGSGRAAARPGRAPAGRSADGAARPAAAARTGRARKG